MDETVTPSADSGQSRLEPLKELRHRREELAARRSRLQLFYYSTYVLGPLMLVLGFWFVWNYLLAQFLTPVILLYGVMPLAMAPTFRSRIRDAEADIQDIDFQIDLQQFEGARRRVGRRRF